MISAAVRSSFLVLRMRPAGASSVSVGVAAHERHHGDAGLEARQAERQLRETAAAPSRTIISGWPCCANSDAFQLREHLRMCADLRAGRRR